MDNAGEEYLLSTIKVEFVDIEEALDNEETTNYEEYSDAAQSHPDHFMSPMPTTSWDTTINEVATTTKVVTQCKMLYCNWTTTAEDARMIYYKLLSHARLKHKQVTDICDLCYQMFDSHNKFKQHVCSYECHFCATKFNSEIDFLQHIRNEYDIYDLIQYNHQILWLELMKNDDDSINCQICDCKFFDDKTLMLHLSTFHLVTTDVNMDFIKFKGPAVRKLVCNACSAKFTYKPNLKQHYFKVHNKTVPSLHILVGRTNIKYHCNLCTGYKPFDFETLQDHYVHEHNKRLDLNEFDFSKWHTTVITELCNEEGKLKFSCQNCPDFYSTAGDLNRHHAEMHGECTCIRCKVKFDTENALEIHMEEVHLGECRFCDFKTYKCTGINVHVLNQHKDHFDPFNLKSYYKVHEPKDDAFHICTMCERSLSSPQSMKMHYFWFHKRYFCDYCKMLFSSSSPESEHYAANHLTDCIHCSQKFTDSKELVSHLELNHLNEKYCICEFCGDSLENREQLAKHRSKHEVKKVSKVHEFLCSECGQQFKKKKSLDLHVKNKHTKNDLISNDFCKLCSKKFKNIMLHMFKTHGAPAQEKKTEIEHRCKICKKVFCNFGRLRKHMITHSKYKCPQCPMQFNLMVNLEQHISELHTNRYAYSCTVCAKIFSSESDFNLHMKFHGVESKADLLPVLRCELCDEFCLNRDAMLKHVKSRHVKQGKLVNVKRKKPSGRPRYIKRAKKNSTSAVTQE